MRLDRKTLFDEQETAVLTRKSHSLIDAQAGYSFAGATFGLSAGTLGDRECYRWWQQGLGRSRFRK